MAEIFSIEPRNHCGLRLLQGTVGMAVVLPALLAFNVPPSATFLNQAAALMGWGAVTVLLAAAASASRDVGWRRGMLSLGMPLVLLCLAALLSPISQASLPCGLALSSAGLIAAAALTAAGGAQTGGSGTREVAFRAFCIALLVAGASSLMLALVQYFAPDWADGNWIARPATPGRAGGNLRQPNHLSSLLLWSVVALVWLYEAHSKALVAQRQGFKQAIVAVMFVGLVFGVVLTVSRTGTVCIVLLALWGVLDKSLSRFSRMLLWLAPLIYVLCWLGMAEWGHTFAGGVQLHKSDLSSSRFGIWANTLSLIAQHPWFGVGWGEFNFAWTLTPFPGRPVAFFDHTHNLVLQFLVELGIPLGTLVLALLAWALWKAFVACREARDSESLTVRTAFVMVLMMVVHSMLEYPLWYAYFLLPTAFAFGICLRHAGGSDDKAEPKATGVWLRRVLLTGSMALVVGATTSVIDYLRVVAIFVPSDDAPPLSVRIAEGQRSWFFAHHADYAAATTAEHPSEAMEAFKRAPHYLLDTRLMMAWAQAFNERGDVERARYIAQRLKEFRNPASDEFFAECDAARAPGLPLPFQCTPPVKAFTYEDFRQR